MSGVERLPAELPSNPESTAAAVARCLKQKRGYDEMSGKLFTRMLLATVDSTGGRHHSPAAHAVQVFISVGTVEFGDGYGGVNAVEPKRRLDDESRVQDLYKNIATLKAAAAKACDAARITREKWCIFLLEVGQLGDSPSLRNANTLLNALSSSYLRCD